MSSCFTVLRRNGRKRIGLLKTIHGKIITPAFGPDATRGIIKNLLPHEILDLTGNFKVTEIFDPKFDNKLFDVEFRRENDETQFLLSNTYHLMSYPGEEFIYKQGGIHKFLNWKLPVLTDSGGFQVFSLIHKSSGLHGKVTDDGAIFKNPHNGDVVLLTPEKAIEVQFKLGSDIMVVLDDCRHYRDQKELRKSVFRTIEWARRSKIKYQELLKESNVYNENHRPLLFCVIQGGIDYDLRKLCTEELIKIGFDGYGFGGWAINEKEYFPYEVLNFVANMIPEDCPRYAMGVGTPENIKLCIEFGYDLFDCVIPTRNARHGLAYTTQGQIKILNGKYKNDPTPLEKEIISKASFYTKEYIHHLFKIKDPAGGTILTIQNLKFYNYITRTHSEKIDLI